ncbi:hypothetical protein BJX76DRAFT_358173 [Aspergillus varians]
MAARTITYIWKIPRPANEGLARALLHAAYKTAVATDPNTTTALIRSRIHPTTRTGGVYRPDQPHITIAVKNALNLENGTHRASHGYTPHMRSCDVINVRPSEYEKPDSMRGVWPDARMAQ